MFEGEIHGAFQEMHTGQVRVALRGIWSQFDRLAQLLSGPAQIVFTAIRDAKKMVCARRLGLVFYDPLQ